MKAEKRKEEKKRKEAIVLSRSDNCCFAFACDKAL